MIALVEKKKPLRCWLCRQECDTCDYALDRWDVVELPTAADVDKFLKENPKAIIL